MKYINIFRNSATILAASLTAGHSNSVLSLGRRRLPNRVKRSLIRLIKADNGLTWTDGVTTTANGVAVSGFAIWNGTQATTVGAYTFRHRLFTIYRPDDCRLYAVPVEMLGRKIALPDLALADFELEAYQHIADRITPCCAENMLKLPHPAKAAIKSNRAEWRDDFFDEELLAQLLKRHAGWIFPVIAAALDAQFRSFTACTDVPTGCYNFIARKPSMQAEQTFCEVLGAMNFTVQGECCCSTPVSIIVQDATDLADWTGCPGRIVLLRSATGTPLHPLFDKLDEYIRQSNFGGVLPPRLATVPIIRSRTFFGRADTLDFELPSTIDPLADWELDLLRITVARTITKSHLIEVLQRWHCAMHSRMRYRLNSFKEWRCAVIEVFLGTNLSSHGTAFDDACDCWETAQESQFRAEVEREDKLQRAIEQLGDQRSFEGEIIPKPSTANDAIRLLDKNKTAIAFRHVPTQGSDKGKRFIVFSNSSLLRLLQRAGLSVELYEIFKKRASELGLLVKQSKPVKLGDQTFNGFWIVDQKL